jgi:hypothetical protein
LRVTNDEKQIATFFAKYDPPTAKLGKAVRAKLRDRLPGLRELVYVYERQNSLVLSYSPTEAGADAVCAVALDPRGVRLYIAGGERLSKSDPSRLLHGRGKAVRHIVLNSIADFDRVEIEALIVTAVELAKVHLDPSAKGSVVIKAGEQKARVLRAKKAARATPKPRTQKARR